MRSSYGKEVILKMRKRHIPIFMSVTNDTLEYLAVTVRSINDNLTEDCVADLRVLTSDLASYNRRKLRHMKFDNVEISIVDVNAIVEDYRADFEERLGYFHREDSFYPFFIADMYPRLAKAMYVECGTLFRDDVEKIYHTELGEDVVGGIRFCDEINERLRPYRERWVGVDGDKYIESSIMIINLSLFRKYRIGNRFARLLMGYNFDTVSAASDYMNFLCKGRVCVLNDTWKIKDDVEENDAVAIFTPYRRPWYHVEMRYADEFWDVSRKTPFYNDVRDAYLAFGDDSKDEEAKEFEKMLAHADELSKSQGGFHNVLGDNYLL